MERRYFVLLVEDEPLIQALVVDVLEGMGVRVSDIASSATEALRLVERGGFDGAILDCMLNGSTCEAVAKALADKGVPYIIMSGHSEQAIAGRFPGIRYVAKPFLADELEDAVGSMLPPADEARSSNDNLRADMSHSG